MRGAIPLLLRLLVCVLLANTSKAVAQAPPFLAWVTNSTRKLEQIIGDADWATGSNTTSQTIKRFNIVGADLGCSFVNGTNLLFFFGDTIGSNVNYKAADAFAACPTASGEEGLRLNFFTNSAGLAAFVNPSGISMAGDDTPNAGITISNQVFIVCNTGSTTNADNPHSNDFSVLVTCDPAALLFRTNRIISAVTNGGHFIIDSLHLCGTNVVMFGEGKYRASDIYLATTPASSFLSGAGALYFAGLSNGQPAWSAMESNAVPVVQDNPTNGPPWPNDSPSVGNMSVTFSDTLGMWLMTYDGGRNTADKTNYTGVYFCSAPQPWGPWSKPQLIFNATRDGGDGVFIHDNGRVPPGPDGPTINPGQNNPTNTPGGVYAPYQIEPFMRVTNSALYIYYTMSTWNPYTVVKMRSEFSIAPVIDPGSLVKTGKKFSFAWTAPTNIAYQVDYSTDLLSGWISLTNVITSASGAFNFTNTAADRGGFDHAGFFRLRTGQ